MKLSTTIWNKLFSLEAMVVLYFFLLLVFGTRFTKFPIAGPLYLHDFYLGVLAILAINNRKRLSLRFIPIVIIIGLAIFYLFYSFLIYQPNGTLLLMTIRQFSLFLYLTCAYLIFNLLIKNIEDYVKPVYLLQWIANASIILQVIYILYGFIFIPNFSLFRADAYNYFSPLTIFGIISYGALVLAFEQNQLLRLGKFLFCLLLSTTLGHSSAFFALFLMLMAYLFIRITPKQRFIAVSLFLILIATLLLLPQFTDVNASWRLLYWKHVLQRLTYNKLMVSGFGFGQPYMTSEYANYLNERLHSFIMMESYDPLARYLSPPHNSFLTIAFHIGLIPFLLILVPLKTYFNHLFFNQIHFDKNKNCLIYLLTGCIGWISFNVVLELPHTSTYFWLVYFTTVLYLRQDSQTLLKFSKSRIIHSHANA